MKLIREMTFDVEVKEKIIEESKTKDLYIEGIFLQAEIVNGNGRMYPIKVMENEVNKYVENYVNHKRAMGELNHPPTSTVNLDRVSHLITELRRDNDNFYGKAKITNTPMGDIVRGLIESGVKLGVSSRGLGSIRNVGGKRVVQSDFRLITAADIVADPSAPSAFVNGIMEGKEWIWENGILKEIDLENAKKEMDKSSKSLSENSNDKMIELFTKILKNI